jgi:hypothetical protein
MVKINKGFFLVLILALFLTRFINISWGFPYFFHPDERNIAMSLERLSCDFSNIRECFNPNFFAYGQFLIYLGFIIDKIFFINSFLALRIISALSSVVIVFFCLKTIRNILSGSKKKDLNTFLLGSFLLFIFSPGLIQSAHFGTTESLLTMFYTAVLYLSILNIKNKISDWKYILLSAVAIGAASATKISSLIFLLIPTVVLFINNKATKKIIYFVFNLIIVALLVLIILSPFNIISFNEFINTVRYESNIALGNIKVFYTTQFEYTVPIIFHLTKIFPYSLGVPVVILFILGFILLPYNKINNFLRIMFLIYFIPTSFLYVKWTRFTTPIFPLMIVVALLFLFELKSRAADIIRRSNLFFWLIVIICIIPGVAFLSIYLKEDVRVQASRWINKNIPSNSIILSESGNVVDVPVYRNKDKNYQIISFDFYNLDNKDQLKNKLTEYLKTIDYIIVPSRRVFASYTCLTPKLLSDQLNVKLYLFGGYKNCEMLKNSRFLINEYYKMLFDGKKFKKVKEFTSYPTIELFGKKLFEMRDEFAEETFSVFDHPVIRIYKRI